MLIQILQGRICGPFVSHIHSSEEVSSVSYCLNESSIPNVVVLDMRQRLCIRVLPTSTIGYIDDIYIYK